MRQAPCTILCATVIVAGAPSDALLLERININATGALSQNRKIRIHKTRKMQEKTSSRNETSSTLSGSIDDSTGFFSQIWNTITSGTQLGSIGEDSTNIARNESTFSAEPDDSDGDGSEEKGSFGNLWDDLVGFFESVSNPLAEPAGAPSADSQGSFGQSQELKPSENPSVVPSASPSLVYGDDTETSSSEVENRGGIANVFEDTWDKFMGVFFETGTFQEKNVTQSTASQVSGNLEEMSPTFISPNAPSTSKVMQDTENSSEPIADNLSTIGPNPNDNTNEGEEGFFFSDFFSFIDIFTGSTQSESNRRPGVSGGHSSSSSSNQRPGVSGGHSSSSSSNRRPGVSGGHSSSSSSNQRPGVSGGHPSSSSSSSGVVSGGHYSSSSSSSGDVVIDFSQHQTPSQLPWLDNSQTGNVRPPLVPISNPSIKPSAKLSSKRSDLFFPMIDGMQNLNPSSFPSRAPSSEPSFQHSLQPSDSLSNFPTKTRSAKPSPVTTSEPSSTKSLTPSSIPSRPHSSVPSFQHSSEPSDSLSTFPTKTRTGKPSLTTTSEPSSTKSLTPSSGPISKPSSEPTSSVSNSLNKRTVTTDSQSPSENPTFPPTLSPSKEQSSQPSSMGSLSPSIQRSNAPTSKTSGKPSIKQSMIPSSLHSQKPTSRLTTEPTVEASSSPSFDPSRLPSIVPSVEVSSKPTVHVSSSPSSQPTKSPTMGPSETLTKSPTMGPSETLTKSPTIGPSETSSTIPSATPSKGPSPEASTKPSRSPTNRMSVAPSENASVRPSSTPTDSPSTTPVSVQGSILTRAPTSVPSIRASMEPSSWPSFVPSSKPSISPTSRPSKCQLQSNSITSGDFDSSGESTEMKGIMFDVDKSVADNRDVVIEGFGLNIEKRGTHTVQVYSKEGTHEGFVRDEAAWTSLGTYSVEGEGEGEETSLSLFSPVTLPPTGTRQAFYFLQVNNDDIQTVRDNTDTLGASDADENVAIYVGTGRRGNDDEDEAFSGGNDRPGLIFSGRIYYNACFLRSS